MRNLRIHLQRDLDRLKKDVLGVGGLVEQQCIRAVRALVDRRVDLAEEVLGGDDEIDRREVEVEEEGLKILALHQPVAADLRFIVAALKVNSDLERMGDLSVNIAERAVYLALHDPLPLELRFAEMAKAALAMVRSCLDAFVRIDVDLAREVLGQDDEVDRFNGEMATQLQELMMSDSSTVKRCVHALLASRHLERIADLATNVAEDVVFIGRGDVVRHQPENYA